MREGWGCFSPLTKQLHVSLEGLPFIPKREARSLLHEKDAPLSQSEVSPILDGAPTSQPWKPRILPECPVKTTWGEILTVTVSTTEALGEAGHSSAQHFVQREHRWLTRGAH